MLSRVDGKPLELVVTAATRAKMCELLARAMQQQRPDKYFTVGLLSLLDAFMDKPMSELLNSLPLSAELNNALLTKDGILSETLRCVVSYEKGEWDKVSCSTLADDTIRAAYFEAVSWSSKLVAELARTA
jgi:EAL and modified HD-GYP domain-containing signal transduction protein